MYGTMFWRWWRSREIILEFYIWKTLLNVRGSKLWIFSPIISVEKVGVQSSDGRKSSSATYCLSAFLHFWCWLIQMFRKASLQKGSTDVLDSVVLSKRKRHLNVLTLKEKIASNSNPTEMFWNSKQQMQISSKSRLIA